MEIIRQGRRHFFNSLALIALTFVLTACLGAESVKQRDADAGIATTFAASQTEAVAAAKAAFVKFDLDLTEESSEGEVVALTFSRSATAFSWGEVGRMLFTPTADGQTQVNLTTHAVAR
jgi:hypothetical protein